MNLYGLIVNNRSVRTFDESVKIPREYLVHFADCARLSASSRNAQVLKFRLVYKEEEVAGLLPLTRWAGYITDRKLPPDGQGPVAFIVICHDVDIDPKVELFQKDVGIAAQSITLAAAESGYGGCMIGSFSPEKVAELLGLGENLKPQLVIALGKCAESIVLCEVKDGDTKYFRDDAGLHLVPKRSADEVILG